MLALAPPTAQGHKGRGGPDEGSAGAAEGSAGTSGYSGTHMASTATGSRQESGQGSPPHRG